MSKSEHLEGRVVTDHSPESSRIAVPEIWGNVPQRNRNFTGREDLLEVLRSRANASEQLGGSSATAIVPQALYGLGGVGKTQLAIEYAYRYAGDYQLVWWIPAEQIPLVRSTLAALAPRLGITGIPPGRVEDLVAAVRDALRRGQPYKRWLLVFDNADQPELIREYMPPGPGHVLVTSRNRGWATHVEALQVDVFSREESRAYLQRRAKIEPADAERLAEELGDLPLALEQAAALLAETALTVSVYLDLLAEESDRVLGENPPPADYPVPVAAAWSLSVARLREQTPYAMQLLQLCAFFGPAPISLELLDRGRYVLGPPMQDTLRDHILMGRAIRALGRYSLAKIDNYRQTLEVHRIIQRLIRNELDAEVQAAMRHDVHLLLAASDPGDPDNFENWPKYAELLTHENPAQLVTSENDLVRRLEQNIVRYLYSSGDYPSALTAADKALKQWTKDSGENNEYVLIMNRLKAQVLRAVGRYQEAYELASATFERMSNTLGSDHEETLILMNGLCVDLRVRGDFRGSLELNRASVQQHRAIFGNDHPRTYAAVNNLAEDLELNSHYSEARKLNEELYEEKRGFYIRDDHPQVLFTLNALARAMREEGNFLEAREKAKQAYDGYRDLVRQHALPEGHPRVLLQMVDFSTASRAAGTDPESLALAQEAYDRYTRAFGPQHAATLAAAFNLGNAQRILGDLESASKLLATTEKQCGVVFGDGHPYTLASALNLSIIRRRLGEAEAARDQLAQIHIALSKSMGATSHPALICAVNLANALSDLGRTAEAVEVNEAVLPQLTELLGDDHPHTLTCAANLALDLGKLGEAQRADDLARETIVRYRRRLGDDHPEVIAATAGERQDLGIEVPVLF